MPGAHVSVLGKVEICGHGFAGGHGFSDVGRAMSLSTRFSMVSERLSISFFIPAKDFSVECSGQAEANSAAASLIPNNCESILSVVASAKFPLDRKSVV